MPKDFNQSTSLESYLKLQWVYSNTSTIIIRTLYVSSINRGTQREYSSKPLKHSIVKRILVFKR